MQPHITLLAQGADAAAVQRTLAGLSGVRLAVCGASAEVAGMLQGKAALYPSARKALACRAHGWTLLVQAGTQLSPDLWSVLEREAAAHPDAAALDCRTLPLESGKLYHPVTLQTAWPDGRAVFLDRAAVQKAGGFANWPVQAALADLGLRLTLHGFGVYYCPNAAVRWDLPADPLADYCTAVTGSFLLACRYSGLGGIVRAKFHMLGQLLHPQPFPHVRPALLRAVGRAVGPAWAAFGWRFGHPGKRRRADWPQPFPDDSRSRQPLEPVRTGPLVSVVIRTCQRPAMLRETLACLRHQTYRRFEVVVVEDGPAASRQMIAAEFPDLPIRYHATGQPVGRGRAGNIGLEMAKGEYCNFLDQDDYFYADHLEAMVSQAVQHPGADLLFGTAMEWATQPLSQDPYRLAPGRIAHLAHSRIDRLLFCHQCPSPIQTVLFRRSLFERLGGLHEQLQGGEDWYMWLKFLQAAHVAHPGQVDVARATSVFVVPADAEATARRLAAYRPDYEKIFEDDSLRFEMTPAELRRCYLALMGDVAHLYNAGQLGEYLRGIGLTQGEEA